MCFLFLSFISLFSVAVLLSRQENTAAVLNVHVTFTDDKPIYKVPLSIFVSMQIFFLKVFLTTNITYLISNQMEQFGLESNLHVNTGHKEQ